jgi:hypothetical protein
LLPSLLVAAVMAVPLSGCSLFSPKSSTTTGAASAPVTATSAAATQAPSASTVTTGTTTTATTAPSSATATRTGACQSGQLSATLTTGGGGGAGHQYPYLVLTNTGATACTLTGYPGVSFVGGGNGTQLGAPADREAAGIAVTTITLAPGSAAHSQLSITMAGNYDAATCHPQAIDGVRVYPPNQTAALFIATTSYTGCANATVKLLLVRPLQAGAA